MKTISHEVVIELLEYSPTTGVLKCRKQRGTLRAGAIVGNLGNHGYLQMNFCGQMYLVHRVVFFYMTGRWPAADIDHRNRRKTDNRWTNLREATRSQNAMNRCRQANNRSGFKGVSFSKKDRRWCAFITLEGRQKYLGGFDTPQQAHAAYRAAAALGAGQFARAA